MPLSSQDAAQALSAIEDATQRSARLRGYAFAAPHLILWGVIYAAAYGFGALQPRHGWLAWLVLVPLGGVGDALIARSASGRAGGWRMAGVFAATFVFIFALIGAIEFVGIWFRNPHLGKQIGAFVPLVVAVCYVVLGCLAGPRLAWTGIALAVVTLVGFFALPHVFLPWMAVAGGGALVLGGVWLNHA